MSELENVKILYRRDIYPELLDIESHGNFIDLRCADTIKLEKGKFYLLPLGVCIELPQGYWGQIVPRSSTFTKYGIIQTNSFGVIDTSYCGLNDTWKMPVLATRDITIPLNERICQFRIVKDNPFILTELEIDDWKNKDRGGFGSTGRV